MLYLILVPWFGGTGAALSFTLGSVFGLIATVVISKKIGMVIFWKEIAKMAAVPLVLAFFFSSFEFHPILGILLSIVASYVIYLKLMLIDRIDVQDYLHILPTSLANPLIRVVDTIASKINGRY
jgi:hypothetical protein